MRPKRISLWIVVGVLVALSAGAGWHIYEPFYQRQRAHRLLSAGQPAEAEQLLRKAASQRNADCQTLYIYAQALRHLNQTGAAIAALDRAQRTGLSDSLTRRERLLLRAESEFAQVEPTLQDMMLQQPSDVDVLESLARGYSTSHRWPEAERACSRLLDFEPSRTDILLERGRIRQEQKDLDQAIADLLIVVERSPNDFEARLLLAQCLLNDARIEETEHHLQICRQLRPERAEPLIGLAGCAVERRNDKEAEALLRQALAIDPRSTVALHELGQLLLERGDSLAAIPLFERIVEINPQDKQAYLKLSQTLRRAGNPEKAQKHWRRYQELDGQIPDAPANAQGKLP
jgi:tetratricopeptide (TPR) repeat protein